jgi:hypothetical protein
MDLFESETARATHLNLSPTKLFWRGFPTSQGSLFCKEDL